MLCISKFAMYHDVKCACMVSYDMWCIAVIALIMCVSNVVVAAALMAQMIIILRLCDYSTAVPHDIVAPSYASLTTGMMITPHQHSVYHMI